MKSRHIEQLEVLQEKVRKIDEQLMSLRNIIHEMIIEASQERNALVAPLESMTKEQAIEKYPKKG